ncbi:MAG: hypothetical protein ACFE0O_13170 [Opitutales bacterium]
MLRHGFKTRRPPGSNRRGFALILALSLTALVVLLLLGMAALVRVENQTNRNEVNKLLAQETARLAVLKAVGQLQKNLGPDRRTTARADLMADGLANSHWVRAWQPDDTAGTRKITPEALDWLVSGDQNQLDPTESDRSDHAVFIQTPDTTLSAPKEDIRDPVTGAVQSRLAYVVMDESAKANLVSQPDLDLYNETRWGAMPHLQPTLNTHFNTGGDYALARLFPNATLDFSVNPHSNRYTTASGNLSAVNEVTLLQGGLAVEGNARLELATRSLGVLANVRDGGLKTDFSSLALIDNAALWTRITRDGNRMRTDFVVDARDRAAADFNDNFQHNGVRYGWTEFPTFGGLHAHANLWRNLRYRPDGEPYFDLADFEALRSGSVYQFREINAGRLPMPVIARHTWLYSVLGVPGNTHSSVLALNINPVIVLHNPYNVGLQFEALAIEYGLHVFGQTFIYHELTTDDSNIYENRNEGRSLGQVGTEVTGNDNDFIKLVLTSDGTASPSERIYLKPGEFKIYSVAGDSPQPVSDIIFHLGEGINYLSGFYFTNLDQDGRESDPDADNQVAINPGDLFRVAVSSYHDAFSQVPYGRPPGDWNMGLTHLTIQGMIRPVAGQASGLSGNIARRADIQIRVPWGEAWGHDRWLPAHEWSHNQRGRFAKTTGSKEGWSRNLDAATLNGGVFPFQVYDAYVRPATGEDEPVALRDNSGLVRNVNYYSKFPAPTTPTYNTKATYHSQFHSAGYSPIQGGGLPMMTTMSREFFDPLEVSDILFIELDGTGRQIPLWGDRIDQGGQGFVVTSHLPLGPPSNLTDFNGFNLLKEDSTPTNPIGGGFGSPFIEAPEIFAEFSANSTYQRADTSYLLNNALFDSFTVSGIGPDYRVSGNRIQEIRNTDAVVSDPDTFGFDRAAFPYDQSLAPFIPEAYADAATADLLDEALAPATFSGSGDLRDGRFFWNRLPAFYLRRGAFNLNSTSPTAWAAQLARNQAVPFEITEPGFDAFTPTAVNPDGFPVSRATRPTGSSDAEWNGYRELDAAQIDALADNIVTELKRRARLRGGPYLALGDFLNREVDAALLSADPALGGRSLLEQAIQNAGINSSLASGVAPQTTLVNAGGPAFANEEALPEDTRAGIGQWVMQTDLVRLLEQAMNVRSDTFKILAQAEVVGIGGGRSEVYAQALVQRVPDFVEPDPTVGGNDPWDRNPSLTVANQAWGRQFRIVDFKWVEAPQ